VPCRDGLGQGCMKQHTVGREAEGLGLGFRAFEAVNPSTL
jgi:hypothetical protein